MAEAQFIPGQGAGNIIGGLNSGIATGSSMMERKRVLQQREQQLQIQQEQNDRARQQFDILAPAMRAKSAADVVEAQSAVAGLIQTEDARAQAAGVIPSARAEFDQIMQLADPDMREHEGLRWIGRYGHLDNVAAYSAEFKAKKDVVANIHKESTALRVLQQNLAGQKDVAKIRGETSIEVATTRAEAGDKIARYRALLAEARQTGDTEGEELYSNLLQKAQSSSISTAHGSELMHRRLESARAAGDTEEVAFWEKRIRALTERGVRKPAGLDDPRAIQWLGGAPSSPTAKTTPAPVAVPAPAIPAAIKDPFSSIKL